MLPPGSESGGLFKNKTRSYALLGFVPEELLQELRVEPDTTISLDRRDASDTSLSDRCWVVRRRDRQVQSGRGDGSQGGRTRWCDAAPRWSSARRRRSRCDHGRRSNRRDALRWWSALGCRSHSRWPLGWCRRRSRWRPAHGLSLRPDRWAIVRLCGGVVGDCLRLRRLRAPLSRHTCCRRLRGCASVAADLLLEAPDVAHCGPRAQALDDAA
ncbi:unnamed protein product [Trichogramma brassicae]|uniref:Uncharacterized protein n=1 Tax=Trichogramma brassicae TaxID=86971 RepID=A0A6H5IM85_9HYME|nr:unnamed protein product [Trichogramma brassicae]